MTTTRQMSVVYVFLWNDDHVLLLKRRNTGRHDGQYGLPGGGLEQGETVQAAAIREAGEECGVRIAPEDLQPVCVMHIKTTENERLDCFFAARTWSGEPRNMEPEKCSELGWFPADDLPAETIPYIREALSKYRQGEWLFNYGWN